MKIPEDIRLLFIVLLTMGAVAGVAVIAVLIAPVINEYPRTSVRIIVALLFALVTLKFFFYITEAALIIISRGKDEQPTPKKPHHPLVRWGIIIMVITSAFFGWYFLLKYLKGVF